MSDSESAPNPAQSTSTQLIARVRQNDQDAWNQLVSLYAPLVYRWCRQSNLQTSDATDVVQDVFRAVTANIGSFRRDQPGHSFRAWLRTITRNKVLDHFRREQARPTATGGTDAGRVMQQIPQHDETNESKTSDEILLLRNAMELVRQQFEPNTWRAFMLNTIEGQSADQVAQELDMTVQAVWKAKSRVLQRLREQFGDVLKLD